MTINELASDYKDRLSVFVWFEAIVVDMKLDI